MCKLDASSEYLYVCTPYDVKKGMRRVCRRDSLNHQGIVLAAVQRQDRNIVQAGMDNGGSIGAGAEDEEDE